MEKIKFIIIGSGWRSLYYVRIAKALPEVFELCAMYCRTEEKAKKMASENNIYTTTSIEECVSFKPDFAVVVVNKDSIADVSMEWMDRGITVLCETPAALNLDKLNEVYRKYTEGKKLVVAEQYTNYPSNRAYANIINSGKLGEVSAINLSIAHEYHGASLMRKFLGVDYKTPFSVKAKCYEFPTTKTLTRYEKFVDGSIENKKRVVATFEFEGNKVAFYDFDSEQYRSPIRKNTLRVQGIRGEIIDDIVYYLDENNEGVASKIEVKERFINTDSLNPNLSRVREVENISLENVMLYNTEFGLCGLNEDETAIATLMKDTAMYSKGKMESPYPIENAMSDAYMALMLKKAVDSGVEVHSEKQIWE